MRRSALLSLLVALALVVPATVFASHQFTDVPDSHTFHNSIDWMKDNNITVGCNPPANTRYCPEDNVTRGQMAAFMKRLAENRVVDATTVDGQDSTAFLAADGTAVDSDNLGGEAPASYRGSVAGSLINSVTPAAGDRIDLATVDGFVVPRDGGALIASADVSVGISSADIVAVWLEIDDDGTCEGPVAATFGAVFTADPIASVGTTSTAAANAGSHRIDLCASSLGGFAEFGGGSLTVEWVESTQIGTTAGASTGLTPQQLLEQLSAAAGQ